MSTIYRGAWDAARGTHFIAAFLEIEQILLKQAEFTKNSRISS